MKASYLKTALTFLLLVGGLVSINAQDAIKINGHAVNRVDKKKQKQGLWIFYDNVGAVQVTMEFKNDQASGPCIFYNHIDTVLILFPLKELRREFICFDKKKPVYGSIHVTSDSTYEIEIDSGYTTNQSLLSLVNTYYNLKLMPVYGFGQKKMSDFLSASHYGSSMDILKPYYAILTLSSSGVVTKVELPKEKNNLKPDEEFELIRMYESMPRWQPFFYRGAPREIKIGFGENRSMEYLIGKD